MKTLLILAGGFGSRLRSVVSDVPKPLAPVSKEPFLKILLRNYIKQGANNIILLLHFEADKIKNMLEAMNQNGELDGVNIDLIVEKNPLGTGGAILNAIDYSAIDDSFFFFFSDTWLSESLKFMIDSESPSVASVKLNDSSRYGSLKIYEKKILSFDEKNKFIKSGWINAGMYHLNINNFFDYAPGSAFSLEEKILPRLADSGNLNVVKLETEFIDIGVPEDYFRFCKWIDEEKKYEL